MYSKIYETENKNLSEQIGTFEALWISIKNYGNISKSGLAIAEASFKNQAEEIAKSEKQLLKLKGVLSSLITEDIKLGGISTDSIDKIKPFSLDNTNIQQDISSFFKKSFQSYNQAVKDYENAFIFPSINTDSLSEFEIKLIEFNQRVNQIIQTQVVSAFEGIGQAIGQAMVNGTNLFAALGGVLLSTLGDIAIKLGKTAIGIGVAMKAIKLSFKNPATAIAAGVALVAIGSAIKGAASIVSGGASAGGVSGGGSSGSTGQGSSNSLSGFSTGQSGTVVFEIQGTRLVGVLNNTLRRNSNIGGSLQII